jgi:hypothetical protein
VEIAIKSGLSSSQKKKDRLNFGLDTSNAGAMPGDLDNAFAIRRRWKNENYPMPSLFL